MLGGFVDAGDLALLPPVPLVERFGRLDFICNDLLVEKGPRILVPVDPPLRFEESLELEDPVEDLESLVLYLNRLLEQLGHV